MNHLNDESNSRNVCVNVRNDEDATIQKSFFQTCFEKLKCSNSSTIKPGTYLFENEIFLIIGF